jgi:hypothetical protein
MKYIMKILPIAAILFCSLAACSQSKSVAIRHVADQQTLDGPTRFNFFYPKTVLDFSVRTVKESFLPGPYAKFSEKYIGINTNITNSTRWSVVCVTLSLLQEPDYSRVYTVEGTQKEVGKVFELIKMSRLFPAAELWLPDKVTKQFVVPQVFAASAYTDLGTSPFVITEKNTYYSRVPVDSGFIKVPVQKNVVVETNQEDRAKAAADFLFSIRKRRFDLISGEIDHALDGKAMEVSLAELDKLEEAYLSLFIGKTLVDTFTYHFSYVPTQAPSQNAILFRFSEQQGILGNENLSGRPIMVEVSFDSTITRFSNAGRKLPSLKKGTVLFPYILPSIAHIEMSDGKMEMLSCRVSIIQLGQVEYFPVSIW